ncbi:hypothetical protein HPB48_021961 [Haemaphysalis longicornis]|uniref:DDE Tnp4 domain-containing protein n=1 Tax=Haemaphysalis longicornis TaxID=44386 RepID=A0A9J6GAB8_HAELO|nr:hypothetical protein HPB48_021961 [Haemaphysalis longicornis]
MFVSKVYGGRASDTHITVDSSFLDRVEPGDVLLADKRFPGIRALLQGQKAVLVLPPFSKGNAQFTHEDTLETYHVTKVHIHVEQVI